MSYYSYGQASTNYVYAQALAMGHLPKTTTRYRCCICYFDASEKMIVLEPNKCGLCGKQICSTSYTFCDKCSRKWKKCYICGQNMNFTEHEFKSNIDFLYKKGKARLYNYD
jgi:hypothetical protein